MKPLALIFILLTQGIYGQSDLEKGVILFQQKQFEPAKIIFNAILKSDPSHLKAIEYLGDIAGAEKDWDTALLQYKKLKIIKPTEANYFYKYGGALGMKALGVNKLKALGLIEEIKASFENAIVLNPRHIESRWALIELYIKLPSVIGGSESKAVRYSNELMELSPIDGYLSRGHIEEYFNRYQLAEKEYKKAVALTGSKTSYAKLANLYQKKTKEPQKALAVWQEYKIHNQKKHH